MTPVLLTSRYADTSCPSDSALERYFRETSGLHPDGGGNAVGEDVGTRSALGSTELADMDRCERLVWLRYVRRLVEKVPPSYRLLGSLLHVCFRYWYAQFRVGGPPAWFHARSMFDELNRVGRGYPKLIETAKVIFQHYLVRWADDDRAWKVLAIEEEFGVRLGDLFGIYAHQTREEQIERATAAGLCGAAVGLRVDLGDLEVRPTIRVDLAVERSDGVQFEMDLKSGVGQYGKLALWSDYNEYGLAWQPYEYLYIGRQATMGNDIGAVGGGDVIARGPSASQLVFPKLATFMVQRIRTAPEKSGVYLSDRNFLAITPSAYTDVPKLIARQVAKRRRFRLAVLDNEYPPEGPIGSLWSCYGRGRCDYFYACRSGNMESWLAQHFEIEGARG